MALSDRPSLAWGWTSTIYRTADEHRVIKVLDKKNADQHFQREVAAYERVSERADRSSVVLKFFGTDSSIPNSIILELAENGSMDHYLWRCRKSQTPPGRVLLLRWAKQAAEALALVHSCDIIHCDIYVSNFFLDNDLNLKLGDFGACSIDGNRSLMTYRESHQLWCWDEHQDKWHKDISINSEIFALGCAMFHMETCKDPFEGLDHEKDREGIARRIQTKEMPSLGPVPVLGDTIRKCWNLEYRVMDDIVHDHDLISST